MVACACLLWQVCGVKGQLPGIASPFSPRGVPGFKLSLDKEDLTDHPGGILRKQAGHFLVSFASSLLWPWPPAGRSTYHGNPSSRAPLSSQWFPPAFVKVSYANLFTL